VRQLERPALSHSYPVPQPQQKVKTWITQFCWGCVYVSMAIVSGSLGLAGAFLLSNPFDPEPSVQTSPIESFSLRLTQGVIPYTLSRPVNIVVMGIDRVEGTEPGSPDSFSGRSDTLLVVRFNPETNQVNILSIPRDTRIEIPNYGFTKINHANWFGGPKLVQSVITHNFNNLELDRYLRIDTGMFREVIDAIGGVEVNVPKAMQYDDYTQKLHIDLQPGLQTLNGDQAEQFARFRHDEYGDIGRVQRQQILLKALRQKLSNPAVITKVPQLLDLMERYVDTNLSTEELFSLVGFALNLNSDQMSLVMLPGRASEPGEFGASYWLPDLEAQDQILVEQFNQLPLMANADIHSRSDVADRQPQIAIQNASGAPLQAQLMADYLVSQGFGEVYVVEDWPSTVSQTRIIAQRGDRASAESLKDRLNLGAVESSSTGAIESDITIRLGQDSIEFLQQHQDNSPN
jgi:polyisoprenyl-teichoic acid--peptidoglycan teichoic acid transferase